MDDHSSSSRNDSRYSKSVVFPRIKMNQMNKQQRNRQENTDFALAQTSVQQQQTEDFNKYILERLEFTEKTLEAEKRNRNILEGHVQALMLNLQQLSTDMATLQQQVNARENSMQPQNMLLRSQNQVSGIIDIWNRLNMGDLNTIKLSGDLNNLSGEMADARRRQEHLKEKIEQLFKTIESSVSKMEKTRVEFEKNFQVLKVEIDSRINNIKHDFQFAGNQNTGLDNGGRSRQENEQCVQHFHDYELQFDQFIKKQDKWKSGIEKDISLLHEDLSKVKAATAINYGELTGRLDDVKTDQKKALEKTCVNMKENYREAFREVYESITTMQTVREAKLRMTQADLETSINSILRTIS